MMVPCSVITHMAVAFEFCILFPLNKPKKTSAETKPHFSMQIIVLYTYLIKVITMYSLDVFHQYIPTSERKFLSTAPLDERLKSILTRDLQQRNLDPFSNLVKLLNKTTTSLFSEARMESEICALNVNQTCCVIYL